MTLILLLDIDDTLLQTGIDSFVSAYIQLLANHLNKTIGLNQEVVSRQLLLATRKMIQNKQPNQTLASVFNAAFYPALGISREEVLPVIDAFYQEVYPGLKRMTRPRPGALRLVERALQAGHRLVIATNPVFPRTAIEQRLEWAGLPLNQYPITLLTSYENFHFSKPNLEFFAELLGQIGWPELPAVMIGNDWKEDIQPAQSLGLNTFYVNEDGPGLASAQSDSIGGSLLDCVRWLETVDVDTLSKDYSHPDAIQAVLLSTPAAIASQSKILSPHQWSHRYQENEWSLTEILWHLRDVECEVNLPRLSQIFEEADPFLIGVDTDSWAEQRNYQVRSGLQGFSEFLHARMHLIDTMQYIKPEGWNRSLRHAIFGPTPVRELFYFMSTHDRLHLCQIEQIIHASLTTQNASDP